MRFEKNHLWLVRYNTPYGVKDVCFTTEDCEVATVADLFKKWLKEEYQQEGDGNLDEVKLMRVEYERLVYR